MKISGIQDLANVESWEDLRRFSSQIINRLVDAVNGKLSFGDNLESSQISVTFSAANSTISVDHTLRRIPSGYIVTGRSANIQVFDGNTPNTDKKIYLQSSGAGTAQVLVF